MMKSLNLKFQGFSCLIGRSYGIVHLEYTSFHDFHQYCIFSYGT